MKKILSIILSGALCFGILALSGCGEKDPPPAKGKPVLLFQIDAGLGGQGLTTLYESGDADYKKSLENIEEGLRPLSEKFQPAVLINPQHSYKAAGYAGKGQNDPLDRVGASLKYALSEFERLSVKVYFELYSSDCGTNQNGELASLPKPNLLYGDGKAMAGLTMDVSTLAALKEAYPTVVTGVRFHELVGTNQLGQTGDPHGFKVEESTILTLISELKKAKLKLVWSDHSWDMVGNPAYHENGFFTSCAETAERELKSDVTFIYANNTFRPYGYVYHPDRNFPFRNFGSAGWGLSNQSWSWQSQSSSNLTSTQSGIKWFIHDEMNAPPEYMAIYTQHFLNQGANLVQFEPGYYFFNFHNTPFLNKNKIDKGSDEGYAAFYEEKPDFSARNGLKRMTEILLDPEASGLDFDLKNYIGEDADDYQNNMDIAPYTKYLQETLTAVGSEGTKSFDKWIATNDKWISADENRYTDTMFSGDVIAVTRARIWAGTTDDIAVLKRENGNTVAYFYNWYGGLIARDETAFADNSKGKVISLSGGNLISRYVTNVAGDPDELVAVRESSAGTVSVEIYTPQNFGNANRFETKYVLAENSDALTVGMIGRTSFSKEEFLALSAVGLKRQSIKSDSTRPLDTLAVFCKDGENISYETKIGSRLSGSLAPGGEFVSLCSIDITLSVDEQYEGFYDELAIVVKTGQSYSVKFFKLGSKNGAAAFLPMKETVDLGAFAPKQLFSVRKGFYYASLA